MGCSLGNDRFSGGVPFAYSTPANTALNRVTYYNHDHPGNTRLTYTPSRCQDGPPADGVPEWTLHIEHAVDYDPYGSILREWRAGPAEKYLTTHHERDQETGLDYSGARYYWKFPIVRPGDPGGQAVVRTAMGSLTLRIEPRRHGHRNEEAGPRSALVVDLG